MTGIKWTGFEEFLREFGSIPEQLHEEGRQILTEETEGAAQEIRQAYGPHRKTGALESRVRTSYPSTTVLVGLVQSKAPHAHLFEFDHKKRGSKGGVVRGRATTVPIARRRRERMYRRMADMLRRHNFNVGNG